MKNLLIIQQNDFSGIISMHPSTMQPLCTHVDKLVTSNSQICFPAPYLSSHAKYSNMPNMPRSPLLDDTQCRTRGGGGGGGGYVSSEEAVTALKNSRTI